MPLARCMMGSDRAGAAFLLTVCLSREVQAFMRSRRVLQAIGSLRLDHRF